MSSITNPELDNESEDDSTMLPKPSDIRPRIHTPAQNKNEFVGIRSPHDELDASIKVLDDTNDERELKSYPIYPKDNETEQQGYSLFAGFVEQECEGMGEVVPRYSREISNQDVEIGRMLRQIADSFQDTRGRQQVKCMADVVDMRNISWSSFSNLCDVIFEGPRGVTPERIISLFFFFIDAAKAQAQKYMQDKAKQLILWAIAYILKKVCKSVQEAGGWMVVLRQGIDMMYKAAMSAVCILGAFALSTYLIKSWTISN